MSRCSGCGDPGTALHSAAITPFNHPPNQVAQKLAAAATATTGATGVARPPHRWHDCCESPLPMKPKAITLLILGTVATLLTQCTSGGASSGHRDHGSMPGMTDEEHARMR